jgi:hypothetical protein
MGAVGASLIAASILVSRHKAQFRRALPSDGGGYFRTETRSLSPERNHRISDSQAGRDDHVHQKAPAIRGPKNVLDEHIADALANTLICEREV